MRNGRIICDLINNPNNLIWEILPENHREAEIEGFAISDSGRRMAVIVFRQNEVMSAGLLGSKLFLVDYNDEKKLSIQRTILLNIPTLNLFAISDNGGLF